MWWYMVSFLSSASDLNAQKEYQVFEDSVQEAMAKKTQKFDERKFLVCLQGPFSSKEEAENAPHGF